MLLALSATSRAFGVLLADPSADASLWKLCAVSEGISRGITSFTWQQLVRHVEVVARLLRPLAVKPPVGSIGASIPRRLRCHLDPASASLALKLRVSSGYSLSARGDLARLPARHLIHPITLRERRWLAWFARFSEGTLHLEMFRPGGTGRIWWQALHLHDESGDCVACALQSGDDSPLCFPVRMGADDQDRLCPEQRLRRAVFEFRYRMQLMQRVCVLCDAVAEHQQVLAELNALPLPICLFVRDHQSLEQLFERLQNAGSMPPPAIVFSSTMMRGSRGEIAGAMELVGVCVRLIVRIPEPIRIVFVTPTTRVAQTFEKAAHSTVFKSRAALYPGGAADEALVCKYVSIGL